MDDVSKADYVQHSEYADAVVAEPVGLASNRSSHVQGDSGRRPRPPPGKWVDGICCWWKQLYPSCCCAFAVCHGCWLTAQIHEKTKCWNGGLSKMIFAAYTTILAIVLILEATHNLGGHSGWIPWIFLIIVGIPLRLHVITIHKITEFELWETNGQGSYWGEVAIALFCHPCSLAQMARQVYGYDKERYFDGDARLDRADNWELGDSAGLMSAV